jgi:hypothetical protein
MGTSTSEAGILSGCSGENHMNGTKKYYQSWTFLRNLHMKAVNQRIKKELYDGIVQTVSFVVP